MSPDNSRRTSTDVVFLLYLFSLVTVFAVHLFSFTLFDGFSTFSNDAAGYVLLSRKWSPFIEPTIAVLNTWPVHTFPPGFPMALAVTGASHSLYSAHLFVSLCMLASIVLAGWIAYRRLGWLMGGLVTFSFCVLPGVLVSTLGILSENLYLLASLAVLLLYSRIRNHQNEFLWFIPLLFFLVLQLLTRSIGISLVLAVALVPLVDKGVPKHLKIRFLTVAIAAFLLSRLWVVFDPQSIESTYIDFFALAIANLDTESGSAHMAMLQIVGNNLVAMLDSYIQYLTLSYFSPWLFFPSLILLLLCSVGLISRLYRRELDAVYILFYLGIVVIWPYPGEIFRFLHPVMFLFILQGLFFLKDYSASGEGRSLKLAMVSVVLVLIANSLFIQAQLLKKRDVAIQSHRQITHSYEYYRTPFSLMDEGLASAFTAVMTAMKMSAERIPEGSVVASVKHENYAVISGYETVNLVSVIPLMQQMCNLHVKDVDVVFLSGLTTNYNHRGVGLLDVLGDVTSDVWSLDKIDGEHETHVVFIDKKKLADKISAESSDCRSFQQSPRSFEKSRSEKQGDVS